MTPIVAARVFALLLLVLVFVARVTAEPRAMPPGFADRHAVEKAAVAAGLVNATETNATVSSVISNITAEHVGSQDVEALGSEYEQVLKIVQRIQGLFDEHVFEEPDFYRPPPPRINVTEIAARLAQSKTMTGWPSAKQKTVMDEIIDNFSALDVPLLRNFSSCMNLMDGRGFTAGIGGFTSRDGDALAVLQWYRNITGSTRLQEFEDALDTLVQQQSKNTSTIAGFCTAWTETSEADVAFNTAQRQVMDAMYYVPAMLAVDNTVLAYSNLRTTLLTRLFVYDSMITMGTDESSASMQMLNDAVDSMPGRFESVGMNKDEPNRIADSILFQTLLLGLRDNINGRENPDLPPNLSRESATQWAEESEMLLGEMPERVRLSCFQQFEEQGAWDLDDALRCQTADFDLYVDPRRI